jgi:hypothetical protein
LVCIQFRNILRWSQWLAGTGENQVVAQLGKTRRVA